MTQKIDFQPENYWKIVFQQFKKNKLAFTSLFVLCLFGLIGLYAPFFASSKPSLLIYDGKWYFPLFRYLFFTGFFSKPVDIFYNLLMFTLPLTLLAWLFFPKFRSSIFFIGGSLQIAFFFLLLTGIVKDPINKLSIPLSHSSPNYRQDPLLSPLEKFPTWERDIQGFTNYEKINLLLRYRQRQLQHARLIKYLSTEMQDDPSLQTLWQRERNREEQEKKQLRIKLQPEKENYEKALLAFPALMATYRPFSREFVMAKHELENADTENDHQQAQKNYDLISNASKQAREDLEKARRIIYSYSSAQARLNYLEARSAWLEKENHHLHIIVPALIRPFHWEEDTGGHQRINQVVPWWELSRINQKDLVASLIFGIRISLLVGFSTIILCLLIGLPLGMISGYFVGKTDLVICRLIEVWEAMPTFFMLLLIIAITQTKSVFLVISILGLFGWTGLARFMRGEFLKHRQFPYVMACKAQGFSHPRIMCSHIFPNAIPPILTLLPFTMMAAITSEAGISFLGLGEEGSTSWGVLMAEGRSVFPGESYLLWPPALLLTLLLICIALVGDGLRDALDPKMRS